MFWRLTLCQFKALYDHWKVQDEYQDFRFGQIGAAIYNQQRDTRKHGMVKWYEMMPRWSHKYELQEKKAKMAQLQAYLMSGMVKKPEEPK